MERHLVVKLDRTGCEKKKKPRQRVTEKVKKSSDRPAGIDPRRGGKVSEKFLTPNGNGKKGKRGWVEEGQRIHR